MAITPPAPGPASCIPPLRITYTVDPMFDDGITLSPGAVSVLTDVDFAEILAIIDARVKAEFPTQSINRVHNWTATAGSDFSSAIQ